MLSVVQCETPAQPANGQVSLSHNASIFGAVADYACAPGYRLVGARRASCLASGLWDKPQPKCQGTIYHYKLIVQVNSVKKRTPQDDNYLE